jgi:hypothetical protein
MNIRTPRALYERWGLKLQLDALDQKLDALTHARADLASRISTGAVAPGHPTAG